MLSVNLTITNNAKAAKLLDLLKELPFVEINACHEINLQETESLVLLLKQALSDPDKSSRVLGGFGTTHEIYLRRNIGSGFIERFGLEKTQAFYRRLAHNPVPNDVLRFEVGSQQGYCQYLDGFRCLYTIGKSRYAIGHSIHIFHLLAFD